MTFNLETIVARAKRRGFAYPGSDIYGGLANARDLGPYGVEIKRNIENTRWRCFVQEREDIIGLDSQILMNSKVREASGHIGGFSDPLVDCKKCQNRERADQLIENMIPNIRTELYKKVSKLIKDVTDKKIKDDLFEYYELNRKIKDHFDEIGNFKKEGLEARINTIISSNKELIKQADGSEISKIYDMVDKAYELKEDIENIDKSLSNTTKALLEEKNKISKRIKLYERIRDNKDANIDFHQKIADAIILENTGVENFNLGSRTFEQQYKFLQTHKIKCPKCGASDWTEPKQFNLMFKTEQGIVEGEGKEIYLRPETAQGIFVNFKNILDTTRSRIPFGIAQTGKAFRNEITPGNFMFRVREFYQMEIEYFVENDEKIGLKTLQAWKDASENRWIHEIGIKKEKLKFREHDKDELSFYSKGTRDVEYEFPRGRGELQGIAYRTDYDLKQHMDHSGKDLQYNDPYTGKRYIPHCIEPSRGLTRAILTAMIDAYDEEKYVDGNGAEASRVVAKFHKNIAPIKFAIIPLVKKDEKMVKMAHDIYKRLSKDYMCEFDDSGNIGKCYRRQDEIGTPYCITVDNQSLEDGTVTIRDRDTMKQERIKAEDIKF